MRLVQNKEYIQTIDNITSTEAMSNSAITLIPENTKQDTIHNYEAAKHHNDAARHYENGDYVKSVESADKAYTHHTLAAIQKREKRKMALSN